LRTFWLFGLPRKTKDRAAPLQKVLTFRIECNVRRQKFQAGNANNDKSAYELWESISDVCAVGGAGSRADRSRRAACGSAGPGGASARETTAEDPAAARWTIDACLRGRKIDADADRQSGGVRDALDAFFVDGSQARGWLRALM